jgi:hypothetical protein
MIARIGENGNFLWQRLGDYDGPVLIRDADIISGRPGASRSLFTGQNRLRSHPITRAQITDSYWRAYGCNTGNASNHLMFFRSGAAGYADAFGNTGNLGGFKAGCTSNMIAADGVLNAPDYTRTCTCSYQNQTSLGFIHMPDVDAWTGSEDGRGSGQIRQLGINLGAAGNRRASNGTLWIHHPQGGAPTPEIDLDVSSGAKWFRKHSLLVDGSQGNSWVGASGAEAITSLYLRDVYGNNDNYTVILEFCDPVDSTEPGDRVFDVYIQGTKVLGNFDVVAQAGGPNRVIRKKFQGISIGDVLSVIFDRATGSPLMPVLSGVELWVESADLTGDGMVTINDFSMFSAEWGRKDCTFDNDWCNGADFLQNGWVAIEDLALLAEEWLRINR